MERYAIQLQQLIGSTVDEEVVVNQYFYWFSWDMVGQFAFSKSFNMMKEKGWHSALTTLRLGFGCLGFYTPVPWLMRMIFDLPFFPQIRDFKSMIAWASRRMDERIEVSRRSKASGLMLNVRGSWEEVNLT